jgi:hypothetical protein
MLKFWFNAFDSKEYNTIFEERTGIIWHTSLL